MMKTIPEPYKPLYEFVKRIADQRICDEDSENCTSDSGPYCGTHQWFIYDDDIREARDLIAKVEAGES